MINTTGSINEIDNPNAVKPTVKYTIPESIIDNISKYIEPIEINLFQNEYGSLPIHYVKVIENIRSWAINNFEKDGLDCNVLVGIMFELHARKARIDEENERRTSSPSQLLLDVDQLLKIEKLAAEKNITLDGISILYRTQNSNSQTRSKNTIPEEPVIKSQVFLNTLLEIIKDAKIYLENIKSRELSALHNPKDKSFTDSRNVFKKLAAPILKKYFENNLSGRKSESTIHFKGGLVLNYLELFHFKTKNLPQGKELRTKLVSNFKKALGPKF